MKLESVTDLYFVVSVLVPGFIYNAVVMTFVPLRQNKEKELIVLRFLTATALNYAVCSPVIYLLLAGRILTTTPVGQAACWFVILFIVPVLLGLLRARLVQRDGLAALYRRLGLRSISPIPTGWDWIFSRTKPCFILITLTDGTVIAGYFGTASMASSDPERKDIYLERVYTVPMDGGPWTETPRTLGMYVDGAQIAYIEFRGTGD